MMTRAPIEGPLVDNGALLDCLRQGCPDAWDRVSAILRPRLRALAASKLPPAVRRRIDPSDIVQETFAEASLGVANFGGSSVSQLFIWLAVILENNVTDALRQHILAQRRSVHFEHAPDATESRLDCWPESCPADQTTPSMCAARNESLAALYGALDRLPPRQREAVRLRHLEGRPIADIAATLGCSIAAAAATVARGLRMLREQASDAD